MMELFKGQVSMDYLFHTLTYKEALLLREARLERLKREKEELENERRKSERQHQSIQKRR